MLQLCRITATTLPTQNQRKLKGHVTRELEGNFFPSIPANRSQKWKKEQNEHNLRVVAQGKIIGNDDTSERNTKIYLGRPLGLD